MIAIIYVMIQTTPLLTSAPSYSLGERLLRTAVFQIGVSAGFFENTLMRIYNFCSHLSLFKNPLDFQRAENTLRSFINVGAEIRFVTPRDGKASIQRMHLKAADLEEKLRRMGARWEKLAENGSSFFAIIPPDIITEEWLGFEKDLLKFKWKKRVVLINDHEQREVIVTCENAEKIQTKDWHRHLFLHANSASVSFIMLNRRIGFYLGCKQDVCFYDPRGTWKSSGIASEAGYYNDIQAVYDSVHSAYDPRCIWVSSACGGSGPSAYLKSLTHGSGVNFIYENGFSDLRRDYVEPQGCFVNAFSSYYWNALASRDIPEDRKPLETGFSLYSLWKDLRLTDLGKVIIINAINDQRLPRTVALHTFELARRVNQQVHHIEFTSTSNDPHMDRYFNYIPSRSRMLDIIFA